MANDDDNKGGLEPNQNSQAPAGANAAKPNANLVNLLHNASSSYQRALQDAAELAAQNAWKAANELADAQRRVIMEIGTRHSTAHRDWCEAWQGVAGQADTAHQVERVNQTYREVWMAAAKEGQEAWEQMHRAHQEALAAQAELRANASRDALKAYLAQIKESWSAFDIDQFDAATLAKLAEASCNAVQAVQAIAQN